MRRVQTAAVGVPLLLVVILWGPDWILALFVAVCSALALQEFFALRSLAGGCVPNDGYVLVGAGVTFSFFGPRPLIIGTLLVALGASVVIRARSRAVETPSDCSNNFLAGLFYTCMLLGFLLLMSRLALLFLLGIIWAGDTAAFYGGRSLGRHSLAPTLSPGKTVEGAVIGALASLTVGLLIGSRTLALPWLWTGLIALLTAVSGQVGDLFESWLKRRAGVKDSSQRLPGHGGVLDRIDSLLFAAPVFYVLLRAVT